MNTEGFKEDYDEETEEDYGEDLTENFDSGEVVVRECEPYILSENKLKSMNYWNNPPRGKRNLRWLEGVDGWVSNMTKRNGQKYANESLDF